MTTHNRLELVCPAGTPAALRAAITAGADTVYCGFRDETNARNFPGLNFSHKEMDESIAYAHARETKVYIAINTFPRAGDEKIWHRAIDASAAFGADAVILADLGLLAYTADRYPQLRRHLSVQAAASNADAIEFYVRQFGVRRVVLPRILTVQEIALINNEISCETEAFIFGGLCVMAEGRCSLSSYVTGRSPNMNGVCSPATHVIYRDENQQLVSLLGGVTIDRVSAGVAAPYPTVCKGSFITGSYRGRVFDDPASLDATGLVPQLTNAGVTAVKVEGRQRSRAYISAIVRSLRQTIDENAAGLPITARNLKHLSEGQSTTEGAYRKTWR